MVTRSGRAWAAIKGAQKIKIQNDRKIDTSTRVCNYPSVLEPTRGKTRCRLAANGQRGAARRQKGIQEPAQKPFRRIPCAEQNGTGRGTAGNRRGARTTRRELRCRRKVCLTDCPPSG